MRHIDGRPVLGEFIGVADGAVATGGFVRGGVCYVGVPGGEYRPASDLPKPKPIPERVLKQGDVTVRILWPDRSRVSMVEVNNCGGVWDGKRVTRCAWSYGGDVGKRVLDTAARMIRKWEQKR